LEQKDATTLTDAEGLPGHPRRPRARFLTLDLERLADGAELVAIAGANGRGKTTVMDNMHPLC
jgi:ABC-type transport system involved in cytochrome c biogenesis ATPase subunit